MKRPAVVALVFFCLFAPRIVFAHRDDYINETFVYQTLGRQEFELEQWFDLHKTRSGEASFFSNSLAFEYGITDHWMMDGIGTLKTTFHGDNAFQRARFETRARFSEEGDWPIDVATSLEYEVENEGEKEHLLSPRLVLSKDLIPKLNTTLNLFGRLRLSDTFKAQAGYALAVRYPAEAFLRYGVEFQGLHPDPNELVVVPEIWFSFPLEITWKLGGGVSLVGTPERFFLRSVFEVGF